MSNAEQIIIALMSAANPTSVSLATLAGVVLCWLIFAGIFIFRKRTPKAPEARRDPRATIGIVLQMIGYFLVWFQLPHTVFLPRVGMLSGAVGLLFAFATVALAIASVWLVAVAVHTLGKQWAFEARLLEGHKLIMEGPYAYIRNPIYTGMLGMLIATGLAMEHWIALVPAIIIFMLGLLIRVRVEEKLLRAQFGQEFDEYANRVPAVLPGIY